MVANIAASPSQAGFFAAMPRQPTCPRGPVVAAYHDVHMQPVSTEVHHALALVGKPREVAGENGRRNGGGRAVMAFRPLRKTNPNHTAISS